MKKTKIALFYPLLLLLLSPPSATLAADWHVSPEGSDGAAGTEDAPLASPGHALERAAAGDRILLQRNGTYQIGSLDLGSNLTLTAYGEGMPPVLTASFLVELPSSWATLPAVHTGAVADPVLACYVNGRFVPLARYPNTGFLRVDNDDDPDRIVDAELTARPGVSPGRWTGAQVRWRRWSWWWETRPIIAHSATDTLELGEEGRFHDPFSDAGSGYFIDGDLDELDAPGEWFWADGTLYLYPPEWANPAEMRVEVVTSAESGLQSAGSSIRHVQLQGFADTALAINGPTLVEDCIFAEIESNAIRYTWNAQPFTIRRCIFRDVRNVAIQGWADAEGPGGSIIERNLFLRIGVERGYGGSGSWHAAGIILGNANAAVFRLNRVIDTGYAGIILGSDGQTVERNVFVRTMGSLNDGAAIYTNCNASIIRENIILDTLGDMETSHPWWPLGHGIWPEFLDDFRDSQIHDNTIYGSNGFGIMLPNNFSCQISGNVMMDNRRAGLSLSGDANDAQEHLIENNILAAVAPSRRLHRPENLSPWWLPPYEEPTPVALAYESDVDYGMMHATTFIAAQSGAAVIRPSDSEDIDNLSDWTTAASWASSEQSQILRANAILLFNDTEAEAWLPVPDGSWRLLDGSQASGSLHLDPFRSVVLVSDNAVPEDPPYRAASGIDWRAAEPVASYLSPDASINDGGETEADAGDLSDGASDEDASGGDAAQADEDQTGDNGTPEQDAGRDSGSLSGGCGCQAGGFAPPFFGWGMLFLALWIRARRRLR
ncbi:MAG: right-handed parallel beta-helix repeat-containing protein [Deltaproteobacteria bacterium]|nr:right-handed parallel beta-helix repeat-containing protein [Deltaproteobacteria bacterium]